MDYPHNELEAFGRDTDPPYMPVVVREAARRGWMRLSALKPAERRLVTAIETGMLTFEGAFLGQILLPSGKTILEIVEDQKMLPKVEQKVLALAQ